MNTKNTRISSCKECLANLSLIIAVVLLGSVSALGKDLVPWKGKTVGQLIPTPLGFAVEEAGVATHVGRFTETATPTLVEVDGATTVVTLIEITAANNDKLFGHVANLEASGFPVIYVEIVIDGGTGRFEGATGSYDGILVIDPVTLTFSGSSEGFISSVGSNKK